MGGWLRGIHEEDEGVIVTVHPGIPWLSSYPTHGGTSLPFAYNTLSLKKI